MNAHTSVTIYATQKPLAKYTKAEAHAMEANWARVMCPPIEPLPKKQGALRPKSFYTAAAAQNRARVLASLRQYGPISKRQLAAMLPEFKESYVSGVLKFMAKDGVAVKSGTGNAIFWEVVE